MTIEWEKVQLALYPVKDYESLCQRMQDSYSYEFVRSKFNLSMVELAEYTQKLLGGDAKGRYNEYLATLKRIIAELHGAGVQDVLDLRRKTESREKLEEFTRETGIYAPDTASLLKFLIYWFIPPEKYLGGLVRDNPGISTAIKVLKDYGIKTNLDLLAQGTNADARKSLCAMSRLPDSIIWELVNRADFSRLPWSSKATISNIIGAGYASLDALANADPEKLYADFFRFGKSIGKNLNFGNEIENSYRIAKIVPVILEN